MYNYINLNFVVTSLSSLFLKFQNSRSFEKKNNNSKNYYSIILFSNPQRKGEYIFFYFPKVMFTNSNSKSV